MMKTLSAGNTLNDTVCICYQNVVLNIENEFQEEEGTVQEKETQSEDQGHEQTKQKYTLIAQDIAIEPYRKKPQITEVTYVLKDVDVMIIDAMFLSPYITQSSCNIWPSCRGYPCETLQYGHTEETKI